MVTVAAKREVSVAEPLEIIEAWQECQRTLAAPKGLRNDVDDEATTPAPSEYESSLQGVEP